MSNFVGREKERPKLKPEDILTNEQNDQESTETPEQSNGKEEEDNTSNQSKSKKYSKKRKQPENELEQEKEDDNQSEIENESDEETLEKVDKKSSKKSPPPSSNTNSNGDSNEPSIIIQKSKIQLPLIESTQVSQEASHHLMEVIQNFNVDPKVLEALVSSKWSNSPQFNELNGLFNSLFVLPIKHIEKTNNEN